jgi:Tol biopolymer transport system component
MLHATSRLRMLSLIALALSACTGGSEPRASSKQAASVLEEKIAFVSTRDNPDNPQLGAEIYMMNVKDGNPVPSQVVRLTNNSDGDAFPTLSPTGIRILFDSNRLRTSTDPLNDSLFVMNRDGSEQTYVTRGTSASWSPDGHGIVFHRSASDAVCVTGIGSGDPGCPVNANPGAATYDSDIFVANVDDLLEGAGTPHNITNDAGERIDEDADWSPDGQKIVFTRKTLDGATCNATKTNCNYPTGEVWVMNADGSGEENLTRNTYEDRSPSWSPDGSRIVYMCRTNGPNAISGSADFEICVMDADGANNRVLTDNDSGDLSPSFSPDGAKIIFHRQLAAGNLQLFTMNAADGTNVTQWTVPPGLNLYADWGYLKVNVPNSQQ